MSDSETESQPVHEYVVINNDNTKNGTLYIEGRVLDDVFCEGPKQASQVNDLYT